MSSKKWHVFSLKVGDAKLSWSVLYPIQYPTNMDFFEPAINSTYTLTSSLPSTGSFRSTLRQWKRTLRVVINRAIRLMLSRYSLWTLALALQAR